MNMPRLRVLRGFFPAVLILLATGVLRAAPGADVEGYERLMHDADLLLQTRADRDTPERLAVARHGEGSEREFHDRFLSLGVVPLDLAAAVLLGKREAHDAGDRHP